MRLLAQLAGRIERYGDPHAAEPLAREWTSATLKHPVSGPMRVGVNGLERDEQADRRFHGGPEKALLACSAEHVAFWRERLNRPELGAGAFGENWHLEGASEATVCLGDVWAVGTARVQVSQPRKPCWKQARRWQVVDLPAQMEATGFTGWYLRVLAGGEVSAGDAIELVERPHPGWTIARANQARYARPADLAALRALAELSAVTPEWAQTIRGLAERR
jgi:MOSC domain-containing protein YiiM